MIKSFFLPVILLVLVFGAGCDAVEEDTSFAGDFVASRFAFVFPVSPDSTIEIDVLAEGGTLEMKLSGEEGGRHVQGRVFIPGGVFGESAIDQSFSGTYAVVASKISLGLDRPGLTFPVPTEWVREGRELHSTSPYSVALKPR